MNRIEIYRDNEIKIEIDGLFNEILENILIKTIKLNKMQYNLLLSIILAELKNNSFNCKGCKIIMNSTAPVIEMYKSLQLIENFQILQSAFDYLSMIEDRSNKDEIISTLNDLYEEQDISFYMNFFEKPIFKINGYMVAKEDNNILISLFVYPD